MKTNNLLKLFGIFTVLLLLSTALGSQVLNKHEDPDYPEMGEGDPEAKEGETTRNIKKFANIKELEEYLSKNEINYIGHPYGDDRISILEAVPTTQGAQVERLAVQNDLSQKSAGGEALDYSETNIQIQGVDEADIVKTDGEYIYLIANGKLYIVDARNPGKTDIVATEEFSEGSYSYKSDQPQQLFVYGDKLVLFVNGHDDVVTILDDDHFGRIEDSRAITKVLIYDISDKKNPELKEEYTLSGYYSQSRLIDDKVYVITQESVYTHRIMESEIAVDSRTLNPDIYYFDNPERNYNLNLVTSIGLDKNTIVDSKTFLLGYSTTIMVTKDNIYIAYEGQREPSFFEEVENLVAEDIMLRPESRQTVIQKIGISNGKIFYKETGYVEGRLLNQFSMDENDGYLRVATTTDEWSRNGHLQYNNVFVLDKNMKLAGKITGIAKNEKIYSTRFIGDRLYMVTFKKVDPFFVIDLSDPKNPEVLGELKIPGYSDYLHPYNENYIIGIGKDAEDQGDFALFQGVKVSLFDVQDVNNPKLVDSIVIGDRGTDSPALYDHKAFLFDSERDMMVLPVSVVKNDDYQQRWNGAYVIHVDENGLRVDARIEHDSKYSGIYGWRNSHEVKRSLFIGDFLYTISDKIIKVNQIDKEFDHVRTLPIGAIEEQLIDYPHILEVDF